MIRYKCTVAYDGSAYCGWQSQRRGDSVQEKIEEALQNITNRKINILAAGRTDAGVNAWGQVFHFDTDLRMSERKWQGAINGFLPKDIHIRKVEEVSSLFHARYCVRAKRYDYTVNLGEYDVFSRNHAYQCPYPVDVERMKAAAAYLVGTHDFTSFNSNTLRETPDQVRTIYSIDFAQNGSLLTISFYGRGFLRYMVRMMTAQILEAGRGRIEPEDIRTILEKKSKTVSRRNAKPEGLTLYRVDYFEVIAENESVIVREYLPEDGLEGSQLHQFEQLVKEKKMPRYYALADRHSQKVYGCAEINDGIVVHACSHEKDQDLDDILRQLSEYGNGCGVQVKYPENK
ncbi:MAG: tRNA pseudouridine(38-40) synthase TruA [Solobacterium sp.]|nr:tRNA pseudouridine(38-40) synthase TruA [Solobacterium sp.]